MSLPFAEVPTIDISPLFSDDKVAKQNVAKQIDVACRGSGFFYAANHGIDVQALQDVTNEFHRTMTDDEKWNLAIHAYNPANPRVRNGYYMAIKDKKAVESFCYLNPSFNNDHPMIRAKVPLHEVNIWPDEAKHPKFQAFNETYYRNVSHLALHLLRGFALALGKDEHFFDVHFTNECTLSSVALIRYPFIENYPPQAIKTAADGTKLSFENHLDVSLITVLFQTPVLNLQVETPQGYLPIPISGENFLINCGTYMDYITNGYYPAPRHRVLYVNQERLSLPFFVNLNHPSAIDPFVPGGSEEGGGGVKQKNVVVPYGEYLQTELKALIVKNGQT
jgi:isopenicillin-N synthase